MNKRKNKLKRKRKRFVIIVSTLLIMLVIFMIKTKGNSVDSSKTSENPNVTEPPAQESETSNKDKIVGIVVSPENYTAHAGEDINLDNIKVTVTYKSGKNKDININKDENFSISADSSLFKIQDNNIVVSDDALTADSGIINVNYGEMTSNIAIKVFNELKDTIDEQSIVKNAAAYDVVANKTRKLPSNYIPDDLVPLDGIPKSLQNPEINQLRKVAYDALKELFLKAKDEKSYELYARSGYRSYKTQTDLYNSYVSNHGQKAADKFSAKPGQSEHQTGLAMDITCASMKFQLDDTFYDKEEGKWVAENAHRFGFIIRYPKGKESITGYQYEPWHLRYVGITLAKEIYENKLTLEEYFEKIQN